jgi:hypothetical protein
MLVGGIYAILSPGILDAYVRSDPPVEAGRQKILPFQTNLTP